MVGINLIFDTNALSLIPIAKPIQDISIQLRRKYNKGLKVPDSIILTTAIHHRVPIVTNDKKLNKIEEANILSY